MDRNKLCIKKNKNLILDNIYSKYIISINVEVT